MRWSLNLSIVWFLTQLYFDLLRGCMTRNLAKYTAIYGALSILIGTLVFVYYKRKHSADLPPSSDIVIEMDRIRTNTKAARLTVSGIEKYRLGQYDAAITDFDEALRITPKDSYLYLSRGFVKYKNGQYEEAIKDYTHTIQLYPKAAAAYNYRGLVKFDLKNYQAAIKDYDEAIRINRKFAYAYKNRGSAKTELKDYDAAIKDYTKAIRLNRNYAEAFTDRGVLKRLTGHEFNAQKDFRTALRLAKAAEDTVLISRIKNLISVGK